MEWFPFVLIFIVGSIALFVYALVDAIRMPNAASFKTGTQLVWILVILLAQGIGAIIYLIVGRPPGGATQARDNVQSIPGAPPPPAGALV
ncbi:MAG: PLDc N-terminal domain-containing protein [Actinomycetota bacterium]